MDAPGWVVGGCVAVPCPWKVLVNDTRRLFCCRARGIGVAAGTGRSSPWEERSVVRSDGAGGMSKPQHSSACCGDAAAERESRARLRG